MSGKIPFTRFGLAASETTDFHPATGESGEASVEVDPA